MSTVGKAVFRVRVRNLICAILGSRENEQQRLYAQVSLYGDMDGITFSKTDSVCEIGCGVGANLWIAQQLAHGRYVGVDNNVRQIEAACNWANRLGLGNTEFYNVDGAETKLPTGSMDATFCRFVLIHQPNPLAILGEMCRITKNGGRVIAIEPHDPTYYCAPGYEHLRKCYSAKTQYAYGGGRGSPNVALNLYPSFIKLELKDIVVRPHIIACGGKEPERCKALLKNLIGMVEPMSDELVRTGLITQDDYDFARQEAAEVTSDTFIYQSMWIAEGRK